MSHTDDRRSTPLPVTAEVGGEGGSYADPTMQVETFQHPFKDQRSDEPGGGGEAAAANYALDLDSVAGGGVGTSPDPAAGMIRYPTEAPPAAVQPAAAAAALPPPVWRIAALGAAAGFVLGMIVARR